MPARFFFHGALLSDTEVDLGPEQAHHLLKVLRLKAGDQVELVDGRGHVAAGTVCPQPAKNSHHISIRISEVTLLASLSRLNLAFAIPKGPALDLIIRKCTEIGVQSFQPLVTSHSLSAENWNQERWDRITREVIKQCQSPYLPLIYPPKSIQNWLSEREPQRSLFFSHEDHRHTKPPIANFDQRMPIDVLVGAEGGWSAGETDSILAAKPLVLGLGANRLRAETAALVAVVLVKQATGEL